MNTQLFSTVSAISHLLWKERKLTLRREARPIGSRLSSCRVPPIVEILTRNVGRWHGHTMKADHEDRELFASIRRTPIATVITNPNLPDNPIVAANRAFEELTGYGESEIVGRNCRFLAGADREGIGSDVLRQAIAAARPALTELLNFKRDGTPFRNAVMIAPVFDQSGRLAYFVGSQMDVGESTGLPAVVRRQRAAEQVRRLTRRQREVLEGMLAGLRNKQIAGSLGLNEKTVKMHRAALLTRLGVPTSADAVRIAVEADL